MNNDLKDQFKDQPVFGFRRNKNLRDMIGQTTLNASKVIRKNRFLNPGKCAPCRSRYNNLCCKQVVPTTTFKSQQAQEEFKIIHKTNFDSTFVIYLLECKKLLTYFLLLFGATATGSTYLLPNCAIRHASIKVGCVVQVGVL